MLISNIVSVIGMAIVMYARNLDGFLGAAVTVLGFILFANFAVMLCPRCRTHVVFDGGDGIAWLNRSDNCIKCGRTRRGVWPLQFLLAPETKGDPS